jgi:hypothetical protein
LTLFANAASNLFETPFRKVQNFLSLLSERLKSGFLKIQILETTILSGSLELNFSSKKILPALANRFCLLYISLLVNFLVNNERCFDENHSPQRRFGNRATEHDAGF